MARVEPPRCTPAAVVMAETQAAAAVTSRPISADLVLAVLLLGSLAAVATYMDVDVDAAIGLSGNTMILIAAIVVFRPEQSYLGVALVAVIGALDYIQVRRRELYKMVINAGIDCLVLLAASAVYWTTAPAGSAVVPNLAAAALGARYAPPEHARGRGDSVGAERPQPSGIAPADLPTP